METLVEFLYTFLVEFVFGIVRTTLYWVLGTPFFFVLSFFGKQSYLQNLKAYYARGLKMF